MPRPSMRESPHSSNLRLHRWSDISATFFVTKSLYPKKPALNEAAGQIVVSALVFAVRHQRIHLRAFVVMPSHWHALFALIEPWTLPKFMHDTMSFVGAKTINTLRLHETTWQDGYYETHIKTAKQFEYVAYHIEQNPVKKGLVERPKDWDARSAKRKDLITDPWPFLLDEE